MPETSLCEENKCSTRNRYVKAQRKGTDLQILKTYCHIYASQMPSSHGKNKHLFIYWLSLKGNPYPKNHWATEMQTIQEFKVQHGSIHALNSHSIVDSRGVRNSAQQGVGSFSILVGVISQAAALWLTMTGTSGKEADLAEKDNRSRSPVWNPSGKGGSFRL